LIDSIAIPYIDGDRINGCKLQILSSTKDLEEISLINLKDSGEGNLYSYQNDLCNVGQKKFYFSENEKLKQFVIVVSVRLRKEIIEKVIKDKIFDQMETIQILRQVW
jgi:hypothetical protein